MLKHFVKLLPVAPPRGERGLKSIGLDGGVYADIVAPPRGERGLKFVAGDGIIRAIRVAPPRGERGLKSAICKKLPQKLYCRSPSWGAWIEITICTAPS